MAALEDRLGYRFRDQALLERALTHRSAPGRNRLDNERLEFLGDRVLGLIIAQALFEDATECDEGALTRRLHSLVNGVACARVARGIGLGEALRLAASETRRGARDQDRLLGDAIEALIAALYLETGLGETTRIVRAIWAPVLNEPLDRAVADPKSELQEWAAANGRSPPAYRLLSRVGPDHRPSFTVEAIVGDHPPTTGEGKSTRAAEKAAALALLGTLKDGR